MNELIAKIEKWAEDRNIIKGSKPIDQAMKLFSEFGELADNVGKGRDCRDDIGDVFVVLTIIAAQYQNEYMVDTFKSLVESNEINKLKSVKHLVHTLSSYLYSFVWDVQDDYADPSIDLECCILYLVRIAELSNTTLAECVQIAYNDIKDRKGVMYNGVFIKESDPAYQDALDNIGADKRMASQKRISVNIEDL